MTPSQGVIEINPQISSSGDVADMAATDAF